MARVASKHVDRAVMLISKQYLLRAAAVHWSLTSKTKQDVKEFVPSILET